MFLWNKLHKKLSFYGIDTAQQKRLALFPQWFVPDLTSRSFISLFQQQTLPRRMQRHPAPQEYLLRHWPFYHLFSLSFACFCTRLPAWTTLSERIERLWTNITAVCWFTSMIETICNKLSDKSGLWMRIFLFFCEKRLDFCFSGGILSGERQKRT